MPLKKCSESGKSGWKWGDAGKCYSGPDGKKKAIQQGISIEGPEKFQQMASSGEVNIFEEDIPFISYALYDSGYSLASIVAVIATIRDKLTKGGKEAGYPPNCKHGYKEKDGKCVPIDDAEAGEDGDMFDNPEGAEKRAVEMGLKGHHTHKDKDGNTIYMPGPTHEAYLKAIAYGPAKPKRKSKAAEYQGRKVQLDNPFRTPDGPKKMSVYVKNEKGNVVKVNFGDPDMEIKRDNPDNRKNFRARHNCDNPGPKWKARYWSCKNWE